MIGWADDAGIYAAWAEEQAAEQVVGIDADYNRSSCQQWAFLAGHAAMKEAGEP